MKGYIFRCNDKTKNEVFQRMLFGEERDYLVTVKQIASDDLLFLYNTTTYEFSGPFLPVSEGSEYIVKDAWQNKFPAQIRIISTDQTRTVPYSRIEKIIRKYKGGIYPFMELDDQQVAKIIDILLLD